ncbi:MAG: AAA family ATPase [Gemmatimonadota bacterium]
MSGTSLERRLAAFLPRYERERVAGWTDSPRDPERIDGVAAVLFADLAGFTPLTRRLAATGSAGAERLSQVLDQTFGRMVGVIERAGGDVVLFAGDAVLAAWQCMEGAEALKEAVLLAASCGKEILATLDGLEPDPEVTLRLRASVGAGQLSTLRVGGVEGHWLFLAQGEAIAQLAQVDAAGTPGQVLLSARAAALIGTAAGEPLAGGLLRFEGAQGAVPVVVPIQPAVPALDVLRAQIPRAVAHRLEAGQDDWLGEFRRLSLLFVGIGEAKDVGDFERLHSAVRSIQSALERFGGSIYSLASDDKGTALIAAFGLPPLAVQDAATRAIGAALEIHQALAAKDLASPIGVTTGTVFCGAYGGVERRHYAIVGPPINLSARLMKAAEGSILCDAATHDAAGGQVAFEASTTLSLKGFETDVVAYRPTTLATRAPVRATDQIVGRTAELRRLGSVLDSAERREGGTLIVEGEAGLGKSTLLGAFVHDADERGVRVLAGGGDSLRSSTLYFGWRSVLEGLLPSDVANRPAALRQALGEDARLNRWAPLLSAIVPVGLPENDTSREMTGETRAAGVQELVIRLLEWATQQEPTILLLEDAHWFDSPSNALIDAVARRVSNLQIVISMRPPTGPLPPELAAFANQAGVERLRLRPLGESDVQALVALALGVKRVPQELVDYVLRQAECHPFHSTELVRALRDRGLLEISGDGCRVHTESGHLEDIEAPASVQEIVLTRVDGLDAHLQLILKTASVIGRAFTVPMLRDVYPVREARARLDEGLALLADRDLIAPLDDAADGGGAFEFRHAIIEDVVYGALLFSQRRQLHRAVAEWYEHHGGLVERGRAPLLAHHWDRAEVRDRALGYLEAAGVEAVEAFSNREAVRFLSRAVELEAGGSLDVERTRRAEWERGLAEARIRLSQFHRARGHLERSLAHYGLRVHRSGVSLGASLLFHVGVQATHRLLPFVRVGGKRIRQRRAHGAMVYKRVAEVAYFDNDKLRLLHATLAALNMAEDCGAVAEQVNGFGSIAIVADLGGMSGLASRYMRRALEVAEASGRPSIIGRGHLLALIRAITRGDWDGAGASAERSTEMFAALGDRFRWETCKATYGYGFLLRGDFERAQEVYEEAARSARHGAPQAQTWARVGQLAAQLNAGAATDYAISEVERLLHAEDQSKTDLLTCSGILARAYLERGDSERALDAAIRTLEWLGGEPPAVYYPLWSIAGAADVFFALAEAGDDRAGATPFAWDGDASASARALSRLLRAHGKMFPICVPTARYYQGRLEALRGRPDRAVSLWREGAEAAQALGLTYDQALLERTASPPERPPKER